MSTVPERRWRFAARDGEGRAFSGVVEAETGEAARRILAGRQLVPITVELEERAHAFYLRRRAQPRALVIFTRQFATLLDAGLPLLTILQMLTELTEDRALREALTRVSNDVNDGSSLSDALRAHPHIFGPIYIHTVRSGEVGGKLPEALNRVADYLEAAQELQDRVVGAMIYPAVVIVVALGAVGVILTFVVPVFSGLFAAEGLELPFSTRILVAASALVVAYWHVTLLLAVGLGFGLRQAIRTTGGRRLLDMFLLRLPFVGGLTRKAAVARLTRAMASFVHSGVSLSDTLLASAPISGNWEVETAILHARDAIQPALIVVLGAVLGGIIVAMYMPVFDLMTSIG